MSKKVLFLLLLFFGYSFSSVKEYITYDNEAAVVSLNISLDDFVIDTVSEGDIPSISVSFDKAAPILEKGHPELPKIGTSLIIDDQNITDIEIVNTEFIELDNVKVLPSKGNLPRNVDPKTVPFTYNKKVHNANAYWPSNVTKLEVPFIVRDFRGQRLNFFPVTYNPKTNKVRLYTTIEVKVSSTEKKDFRNVLNRNNRNLNPSTQFDNIYNSLFINYQSKRYDPLSDIGNMLVICHPDFLETMAPYVEWKNSRGVNTELIPSDRLGKSTEDMKDYISDYYDKNGLTFVLIVGDHKHVPAYFTKQGFYSDHWFGNLKGSDSYVEVIVGRFSGENVADIATQVKRSIEYETNIDVGASWTAKGFGAASDEGEDPSDVEHMRAIRTKLLDYNYTNIDEFYDGNHGGNDAAGNPSESDLANAINDGRGIFNYVGHGYTEGLNSGGLTNQSALKLTNKGKLPFGWFVACSAGDFANYLCFGEAMLRAQKDNEPVGFVACLASTITQPWVPPMAGQNEMNDILVESYEDNIKRTYGGLSVNGIMKMLDIHGAAAEETAQTWTIFGDPSLLVYAGTPKELTVTHPDTVDMGITEITVKGSVEGTNVTISSGGKILGVGKISSGEVKITLNGELSVLNNTLKVTATMFSYKAYNKTVFVKNTSSKLIELIDYSVNDNDGNGNGYADFTEVVSLNVELQNVSTSNISDCKLTLKSLDDEWVEVLENEVDFGDVKALNARNVENIFSIRIKRYVPDNYSALFEVTTKDNDDNTWIDTITFFCNAPVIEITEMKLQTASPEPGTEDTLLVKIKNFGHSIVSDVNVDAESFLEGLSLNTAVDKDVSLEAMEEAVIKIPLSFSSDIIEGTKADIYVTAHSGGHSYYEKVAIEIGMPAIASYVLDFERGEDFDITFSPWEDRDYDKASTIGINGIDWKNDDIPKALISINPEATLPGLSTWMKPHGGKRFGGTFTNWDGANNDWIISPKVKLGGNSEFSMWKKLYSSGFGPDNYNVRISTTNSDTSSFTTLLVDSITNDNEWEEVKIDLSAYDNQEVYVAINFTSDMTKNDAFWSAVDDIVIKTDKGGDILKIVSTADKFGAVNKRYNYNVQTITNDLGGKKVSLSCESIPSWLVFYDNNNGTALLTGVPSPSDTGSAEITIIAVNGVSADTQTSVIEIKESSFTFTTIPQKEIKPNDNYSYSIKTLNTLQGSQVSFSFDQSRGDWLSLEDNGDGTATLSGTPTNDDAGDVIVSVGASNGEELIMQEFVLKVNGDVAITKFTKDPKVISNFRIGPNPAKLENGKTILQFISKEYNIFVVAVLDYNGDLLYKNSGILNNTQHMLGEWDLTNLQGRKVGNGIYSAILKLTNSNGEVVNIKKSIGVKK